MVDLLQEKDWKSYETNGTQDQKSFLSGSIFDPEVFLTGAKV